MRKNSEKLKQELSEKEVEKDRVNAKVQELQKWFDQSQEGTNFSISQILELSRKTGFLL